MPMEINEIIGKNLAELRKAHGLTQREVAVKLDFSDKSVSKWESGETVPDIAKCDRLAGFYQIKMDDLMHYNEKVGDVRTFNAL